MPAKLPRLLAISPGEGGESLTAWARSLADAGVDGVQIRDKSLTDRELFELTRRIRKVLPPEVRLLVNSRLDIAIAAGADGVHLPAAGLPIPPLRKRFGRSPLIGRSTHHPSEVESARQEGADYVTFGPVYLTPSKARYGKPPGLEALRVAATCGLPVFALGGVTIDRLPEVAAADAAGAAGIRCFMDAASLEALVEEARRSFPR